MFTNNPPALVAQISLASTPQPSTLVGILWTFLHIFCRYWLQNLLTSDCSWKNAFVSKDRGNSCKGLKDYNWLTRNHTQHITKINNVLLEGLDVCQLLNEHVTPLWRCQVLPDRVPEEIVQTNSLRRWNGVSKMVSFLQPCPWLGDISRPKGTLKAL
jgi:hypothetical protein